MSGIGEKLYKFRDEHRLSQDEMAEILDVSRQTISNWETGKARPDIEKIVLLCEKFGMSTDELLIDKPAEIKETVVAPPVETLPPRITRRKLIWFASIAALSMIVLAVLAIIILAIDSETATTNFFTVEVSLFIGLMIGSGLFAVLMISLLVMILTKKR